MTNLLASRGLNVAGALAQANGNGGAGGALFAGAFLLIWVVIGLGSLVLTIWALVSAITNPRIESTMKIVWVLVIFFLGPIGAIIYFLVGRNA